MLELLMRKQLRRALVVGIACAAALAGVAAGRTRNFGDARWLWLLIPLVVVTWRRQSALTVLWAAALCAGVGWWRGSLAAQQLSRYDQLWKRPVSVVGVAADEGAYGTRYQLTFPLAHVRLDSGQALPGTVAVSGFGAPVVYRGDIVAVQGRLYPTRGNNQASMSFAQLRVVAHGRSWVDSLRRRFAAGTQSALPEPLASFGLGLLFGQRNTLPADVSQTLLAVGLTHIIAVSGYNLTIMLRAARQVLGKRSKFQTMAACVCLLVLFLAVAGSSPSIVRASFVSGLSLAAWYYGRVVRPMVLLLVSAALSAWANPLYVWGNVSWYLSFLAFFGVLVLAPLASKRLFGERAPPLLASIAIESLCAEAMTMPYILHVFGQASLMALPANLLIAALVPLAMLLSLVAGLAGMLAGVVAGWFAWPARLVLGYMLDCARLLAGVPHAFVQNRALSTAAMFAVYAVIGAAAIIVRAAVRRRSHAASGSASPLNYAILTENTVQADSS